VIEVASHGTAQSHLAVQAMTRGPYAYRFWLGGVVLGQVVPAALAVVVLTGGPAPTATSAIAGLAAVAGLAAFEDAFVRAGQSVPLS
jgi:formate-dependent nitrite reductase membrane component NrfD